VEFTETTCLENLDELADAVITCGAGYPLDLTFYQIVKGVTAAQHITKPGGRILLLGECAEGMGSLEFAQGMRTLTGYQDFLDEIENTPVEVDQWQLERLALVGVKHELFFYAPGVAKSELGSAGEHTFSDLNEAVAALLKGLPMDARVVLVPDGPYTYARAVPVCV
jgi:nickel-dependent lactate racemase